MINTVFLRFLCIIALGLSNQFVFAESLHTKKLAKKVYSGSYENQLSEGIEIEGELTISIADSYQNLSQVVLPRSYNKVKIFKLHLSSDFKAMLAAEAQKISKDCLGAASYLKSQASGNKIDLGMNNVPVLEQGNYGTCSVFVATAAIDALMNAGDYISQQCLLELGVTLEYSNVTSGWNGAWGAVILNRLEKYGVVSQQDCPHRYADPHARLSDTEYLNLSNKLWAHSFKKNKLPSKSLDSIKTALNKGHRVFISTIFHKDFINGDSIYGYRYGLWSLPVNLNKFIREINNGASTTHSTLVIGYDDQSGLLKIRNSWGAQAGVKGNFYMTYQYYKLLNIDAIEIS